MTDYRRPKQTNKDSAVDTTSRGLEKLLALLAAGRQAYPNAVAATSRGMDNIAATGQDLRNDFNAMRNSTYSDIDRYAGLQDSANNMFAEQQSASNQAYARGQQLFQKPGRQAQYAMQQAGMPQGLLDMLNPGQPAYEMLSDGQVAIDDLIAQVRAAGDMDKAAALLQLKQEMGSKAMSIFQGGMQQAQQGYDAASQQAQQGYDTTKSKAQGLLKQLMGQ